MQRLPGAGPYFVTTASTGPISGLPEGVLRCRPRETSPACRTSSARTAHALRIAFASACNAATPTQSERAVSPAPQSRVQQCPPIFRASSLDKALKALPPKVTRPLRDRRGAEAACRPQRAGGEGLGHHKKPIARPRLNRQPLQVRPVQSTSARSTSRRTCAGFRLSALPKPILRSAASSCGLSGASMLLI